MIAAPKILAIFNLSFGVTALITQIILISFLVKYRHRYYYKKRRLTLIIPELVLLLLWSTRGITSRAVILSRGGYTAESRPIRDAQGDIEFIFGVLIHTPLNVILFLRVFYLQFDSNYAQAAMDVVWLEQLGATASVQRSMRNINWYVKNKQTWGNLRWFGRIAFVLTVAMAGLFITLVISGQAAVSWMVFGIGNLSGALACGVLLCYFLPAEYDSIFLRQELMLTFVYMIGLFCLASIITTGLLCGEPSSMETGDPTCFIFVVGSDCLFTFDAFLSTVYVVWKNEGGIESELLNADALSPEYPTWMDYAQESKFKFQEFCRFLVSEFSVENILFLIEYQAFKHKFANVIAASVELVEITRNDHLEFIVDFFPDILGKLGTDTTSFEENALLIFNKYVVTGGEQEINVSYGTRIEAMDVFAGYEITMSNSEMTGDLKSEMMTSLRHCAAEVKQLLNNPYGRLKRTA